MSGTVSITINSHSFSGECELSQTLEQFLSAQGVEEMPELLQSVNGKSVVPRYTLAHLHHGETLHTVTPEAPVASLILEDILSPI